MMKAKTATRNPENEMKRHTVFDIFTGRNQELGSGGSAHPAHKTLRQEDCQRSATGGKLCQVFMGIATRFMRFCVGHSIFF